MISSLWVFEFFHIVFPFIYSSLFFLVFKKKRKKEGKGCCGSNHKGQFLYAISYQWTSISLIRSQAVSGDMEILQFLIFAIEVSELIEGRTIRNQISMHIAILFLQHHCIRCRKGILISSIKNLIQGPTHILLIPC